MFLNLNVKSYYSLLMSTLSINDIVDFAVKHKQKYVALIDVNVLYGAPEFFKLSIANNLIPIIGLEIFHNESNSELLLIAKSEIGYKNLLKISSFIMSNEIFNLNNYLEDIAVILKKGNYKPNKKIEFYVTDKKAKNSIAISEVNCKNKDDVYLINILQAIKNEQIITENLNLMKNSVKSKSWFLTENEAKEFFLEHQLKNLEQLLKNIHFKFDINNFRTNLLQYPIPKKITANLYLQSLCKEGLKKRFNNVTIPSEYINRLKYELDIIHNMGFDNYFLIVYDFVNFAKKNNIIIGPGRGSAVGSLVAYALYITDIDPIKFDLIFERFLNPERKNLPDIDIDIMDTKREKVIDYLFNKYGIDHVAHIITFQRIKAKMAIRDVGRILNINLKEIDNITKLISQQEFDEDLLLAVNKSTKLKKKFEEYPELFEIASKLINIPRQVGTHAAGIVLSDAKLTDIIPTQTSINNRLMSQFSMEYLEDYGLLKIDLLGLKNLTILDNVIKLIAKTKKEKINLYNIPITDKKTFQLFANQETNGIFQFESPGMKKVLKQMKPNNLEDLSLVSSLFRPGPQENISLFIKRKNKEEPIEYISKKLEPYLKNTYGIIIYQEQVIQIVQTVANFTPAEADIFRRAISKKDDKQLILFKTKFINQAIQNKFDKKQAEQIYDYIFNFANYGFNHSHAIAYSLIGYWLCYFKANYSLEFYTVLLGSYANSSEKISIYINEAIKKNINIYLPDINKSLYSFSIINNDIYFGFDSIKGIGAETIKKILKARNESDNKRFSDFISAVGLLSNEKINQKILESLIYAGAFDCFEFNRKTMLINLQTILSLNLFKKDLNIDGYELKIETLNENDKKMLEKKQNEFIGFSFNNDNNIINKIKKQIKNANVKNLNDFVINDIMENNLIVKINNLRIIKTKTNKEMAFATIQDDTCIVDNFAIWPYVYKKYKNNLKKNAIYLILAKKDNSSFSLRKLISIFNEQNNEFIEI